MRYFAAAAEAAGRAERDARGAGGDRSATLRAALVARYGRRDGARAARSGSFLVDGVVSRATRRAPLGARVDVLPPFSGG